MSLMNTEIKPFTATGFRAGEFVDVHSDDLRGQWSVFFFYPADFTFVCPTELGDLADHYEDLRRLGVDRLALYLPHAFDPDTPQEETLQAFGDLVRAGTIGAVGASSRIGFCSALP